MDRLRGRLAISANGCSRLPARLPTSPEAGIVAVGAVVDMLVTFYPVSLPLWLPYEFSWGVYLATTLSILWYVRGVALLQSSDRPGRTRQLCFVLGVALIYAVYQTHVDYAAQHMFFIHRLQHLILHHWSPVLIALSVPGTAMMRGIPEWLARLVRVPEVKRTMDVLQQPFLAAFLFVALIWIWPIPAVHFRAMLDPTLYTVMNWSVTIEGIMFWIVVLDPRPYPIARHSFAVRAAMAVGVMFPQIILGAFVTFQTQDLYGVYEICGRLWPIDGLRDQQIAGIILWIPSSMMSAVALLFILNALRRQEGSDEASASSVSAPRRSW